MYKRKCRFRFYCSVQSAEPKTCPECRQSVTMSQTRRIYFNLSTHIDDFQKYVEQLDTVIHAQNNKLHMTAMELDRVKFDCINKMRDKDYEVDKLKTKINKLKTKLREVKIDYQLLIEFILMMKTYFYFIMFYIFHSHFSLG